MTKMESTAYLAQCEGLTNGKSLADIIDTAIRLIDDPNHHCRGAQARDAKGKPVKAGHPSAAELSLEGAVARACNDMGILPPHMMKWLDALLIDFLELMDEENPNQPALPGIMEPRDIGWFNDHYDHEVIMNFLHEAYRRAS